MIILKNIDRTSFSIRDVHAQTYICILSYILYLKSFIGSGNRPEHEIISETVPLILVQSKYLPSNL